MYATAEGREDADAPVADLVAEALDHDRAVGGHRARGITLVAQKRHQVARRALVEVVLPAQQFEGLCFLQRRELARRRADLLAELEGAADAFALPERDRAGDTGRGRDEHPVAGDFLDPPGRRSEQKRLARARLVDHLLVELANAAAPANEEHAEKAA